GAHPRDLDARTSWHDTRLIGDYPTGQRSGGWAPAFAGVSGGDGIESLAGKLARKASTCPGGPTPQVSQYRSRQLGLASSITRIFHDRRHSFIRRSQRKAASRVSNTQNQTSWSQPCLAVNPSKVRFLCWPMRVVR